MFSYEFKKNNSATLTSGISAAVDTGNTSDYAETDPINLTAKWNDGKNFSLYIDVPTTSGDSATSAYLDFYITSSPLSSTTFAFNYNSGTSLIIKNSNSGASQGSFTAYKKYTPIFIFEGGVTTWLKASPFIRLGCRSMRHVGSGSSTVDYNAWLTVG